jgi:hypothetical protein
LNNSCDPNSEAFSQAYILKLLSKDPIHCLYPTRFKNILIVSNPVKGFTLKNGGTDSISVSLSQATDYEVIVPVSVSKPTNVSISTSSLTFSAENWNVTQTIVMTGLDDTNYGVSENYIITLGPVETEDPDLKGASWTSPELSNRDFRKIIFSTPMIYDGNLGGISGADDKCNTDSLKPPNTGSYKALIVDGVNRRATVTANISDSPIDWVLLPNQLYIRPTGLTITTTNSFAIHDFGANLTSSIGTTGDAVWTGLNTNWTSASGCGTPAWTDPGQFGRYGVDNQSNFSSINGGNLSCGNIGRLYCVQQ